MKKNFRLILLAVMVVLMVGLLAIAVSAVDPEPADADFYQVTDADGAHVGYYATLAEAKAAITADGYTVKVLKDANESATYTADLAKTYTIDGNGKTITFASGVNCFKLTTDTLTIKSLTVKATGKPLYMIGVEAPGSCDVTLENVVLDGGVCQVRMLAAGKLTFKGENTKVGLNNSDWGMWLHNGSQGGLLTIEDGSYTGTNGIMTGSGAGIHIKGGVFTAVKGAAIGVTDNDKASHVIIDGGTFVAKAYNNLGVMVHNNVLLVNIVGRGTLQAGVTAMLTINGGDFIGGWRQIVIGSTNRVFNINGGNFGAVPEDAPTTYVVEDILHFNNSSKGSTVNVTNGNFVHTRGSRGIVNAAGAALNISGGTFTSDVKVISQHDCDAVSDVTVTGGTFTCTDMGDIFLYSAANKPGAPRGKLIISGGDFTAEKGSVVKYTTREDESICEISGGTLKSSGNAVVICGNSGTYYDTASGEMTISGGTFILLPKREDDYAPQTDYGVITDTTQTDCILHITGGLFVNQRAGINAVINMDQSKAKLDMTGGVVITKHAIENMVCNMLLIAPLYKELTPQYTYDDESYYMFFFYPGSNENAPQVVELPSAYVDLEEPGIMFVSKITAEQIAALQELADDETELSYGTLVTSADVAVAMGGMSHALLADYATENSVEVGTLMADIQAENGLETAENGDVTFRAALVKIKEADYKTCYIGLPYVKMTVEGQTVYVYGNVDSSAACSCMVSVATKALNRIKIKANDEYKYMSLTGSGYCYYNRAQQEAMLVFAPSMRVEKSN